MRAPTGATLAVPMSKWAIDLRRIADEDFAVEALGEFDGERGFAGGSGAEDDDEARRRGGVHFSLVREFPAE